MKKNTIKEIFTLLILSAGLIFAACSDGLNTEDKSTSEKTYKISGKILTASENGARMALPSLNTVVSPLSSGKMFVFATNMMDESQCVTTDAFYNSDTQSYEYALLLPSAGYWQVIVNYYCMSGNQEITIARAGPEFIPINAEEDDDAYSSKSLNFIVKPFSSNEINGSTDLLVIDQTSEITKCVVDYSCYENEEALMNGLEKTAKKAEFEFSTLDHSCHICLNDLFPDNYEVTLSFYKDEELLYSRQEIFVVYSGFVTDKWSSNQAESSSDGKTTYLNITQEMIMSYSIFEDYSTPVVLWNKGQSEYIFQTDLEDQSGMKSLKSASLNPGVQIFGQDRVSGARISNPLLGYDYSNTFPIFTIDEEHGNVYFSTKVNYKKVIYQYRPSYSGMVLSKTIEIQNISDNLCKAEGEDGYFSNLSAMKYYEGSLYILFNYNISGRSKSYLASYNLETDSVVIGQAVINEDGSETQIAYDDMSIFSSIEIYNDNGQLNLIYLKNAQNNTNSKSIKMLPFSVSDTEITFGATATTLYSSGDDNSEYSQCRFTDFQVVEVAGKAYLYVLFHKYAISAGSKYGTAEGSNKYFKDGDNYIEKALITSSGGIAKINLQDKVQENWSNGVTYLGLYKGEYYTFNEENSEYTLVSDYMMQPPIEDADKYFYGPKRFIAKKPDQLIIADEGAYCDIVFDGDKKKTVNDSRNINRVVTVDLATESMSAVDVNVGFTSSLEIATSYGIGEYN